MREPQRLRSRGTHPHTPREEPDLEVQVQDVMLMEVTDALADLLGEQDHIQFSQVVLLLCDPVKELTPIHTARAKEEAVTEQGSQRTGPRITRGDKGTTATWGFMGDRGGGGGTGSGLFPSSECG